jgi:hypothetical protein
MTLSKLVSMEHEYLFESMVFFKDLVIFKSVGFITIRGSSDHHNIGSSSEYHGKMPEEYAMIRRSGDKSPPIARRPSWLARFADGKSNTSSANRYTDMAFSIMKLSAVSCQPSAFRLLKSISQ